MKNVLSYAALVFLTLVVACDKGVTTGGDNNNNNPIDTRNPYVAALDQLTCAVGQTAEYNGSTWVCADDDDTNTLGGLSCAAGQVAKWISGAWTCADDIDTDTTLTPDEAFAAVLERDLDNAGLNATTLQGLTASAFATADHTHALPRTIRVERAGDTVTDGTALINAVNSAATLAADGEWVLVEVGPGVYSIGAGVSVNPTQRIHVRGAGREATIIRRTAGSGAVIQGMIGSVRISDLSIENMQTSNTNQAIGVSVGDAGASLEMSNVLVDVSVLSPTAASTAQAVVVNDGRVNLERCVIKASTNDSSSAPVYGVSSGASGDAIVITNSLVQVLFSADASGGAAVSAYGPLTVLRSEIYANYQSNKAIMTGAGVESNVSHAIIRGNILWNGDFNLSFSEISYGTATAGTQPDDAICSFNWRKVPTVEQLTNTCP